jgi:hypothetical protein
MEAPTSTMQHVAEWQELTDKGTPVLTLGQLIVHATALRVSSFVRVPKRIRFVRWDYSSSRHLLHRRYQSSVRQSRCNI